jgi:hypothetical protein
MVSLTFGINGKAKMERKTADGEWLSMQNETVTGLELRNVGKRLFQVKCEWENQTKDGTQMVDDDDEGQLHELGDEASSCKRVKACRAAADSVALADPSPETPEFIVTPVYGLTSLRR